MGVGNTKNRKSFKIRTRAPHQSQKRRRGSLILQHALPPGPGPQCKSENGTSWHRLKSYRASTGQVERNALTGKGFGEDSQFLGRYPRPGERNRQGVSPGEQAPYGKCRGLCQLKVIGGSELQLGW